MHDGTYGLRGGRSRAPQTNLSQFAALSLTTPGRHSRSYDLLVRWLRHVKWIGPFVAVLLVGGGIAMYVYTRPPDRTLDAQGRAWVQAFDTWSDEMSRAIDRTGVSIGLSSGERLDPSFIPALETCSRTLARLGPPPTLLDRTLEEANTACAEVAYALRVYKRYGSPALASTEQHLTRAARWLEAAEFTIERRLNPEES